MVNLRDTVKALVWIAAAATAQDAPDDMTADADAEPAQNEHSAATPNLLVNGGFDEVSGRVPEAWDLYLLPGSDAHGSAETAARTGKYAAVIEMPGLHSSNPVMNWSQNILADLTGKTLQVSGYIRTEEASEAAIWLQCWARSPLRVIHGATTFDTTPVYGTQDWQPVEITLTVPENTDFVTCRCVLRGRGAAWFDDVLVTIAPPTVAQRQTPQQRPSAQEPPPAIRAPDASTTTPSTTPSATITPNEAQRAQAAAIAATAAMNRSLGQLLAEPDVERDTINFGGPLTYPFTTWSPGLSGNDALLQWLAGPAPLPSAPVQIDQEQRR